MNSFNKFGLEREISRHIPNTAKNITYHIKVYEFCSRRKHNNKSMVFTLVSLLYGSITIIVIFKCAKKINKMFQRTEIFNFEISQSSISVRKRSDFFLFLNIIKDF